MGSIIKIIVTIIGVISGTETININGITINTVTSKDGLYKENDIYTYKGSNPNNYITFNGEIWRILYIENSMIKIMKNDSIGNMPFDTNNSNEWSNSSLNKYLNNEYFNTLNKKLINGNIELMTMDNYLKANSNKKLCGNIKQYFKNENECYKTNYINSMARSNSNHAVWTMTKDSSNSSIVYYAGNTYFGDSLARYDDYGVLPVITLKNNIKLIGQGTINNPYKIKEVSI